VRVSFAKKKKAKRRSPAARWDAENRTSNRAGPHHNRDQDVVKKTHRKAKHKKKIKEDWDKE